MKSIRIRSLGLGVCAIILAVGWNLRSYLRVSLGLPTIDQIRMRLISRQRESLGKFPREHVMVALVTGQSNAGNYGPNYDFPPNPRVLNFSSGVLYRAKDPLLGSDGLGSTPWIPLGGMLVERGRCSEVVFALAVRGGSRVMQWLPDRAMGRLVAQTIADLRRAGLPPTHILWQQGEADSGDSRGSAEGSYQAAFHGFLLSLRAAGVKAPVYVAVSTRTAAFGLDPGIRRAQQSLPNAADKVFAGPDADALGKEFRTDGTHFNRAGLERMACLWYDSLNKPQ